MPALQMQLSQAQRHVEEAEKRIEEQIVLIERLTEDGHETDAAEHLLATLIDILGKLTLHRDNLEREAEARRRGSSEDT